MSMAESAPVGVERTDNEREPHARLQSDSPTIGTKLTEHANDGIDEDMVVLTPPPPQPLRPGNNPPTLTLVNEQGMEDKVGAGDDAHEGGLGGDEAIPPPTGWMEWSWVEVSRGDVWGASGAGIGLAPADASASGRFGSVGRLVGSARTYDVISLPSDRATTPFSGIGVDDDLATSHGASTGGQDSQVPTEPSDESQTGTASSRNWANESPPFRPLPPQRVPSPTALQATSHDHDQSSIMQHPSIISVLPQKLFSAPTSITPPPRSTTPPHFAAALIAQLEKSGVPVAATGSANAGAGGANVAMQRGGSDSGVGSGSEGAFLKRRNVAGTSTRTGRKKKLAGGGSAAGKDGAPQSDHSKDGDGKKERSFWSVWWDGVTVWGIEFVNSDGDWHWKVIKIFGAVVAAGFGGYVLIKLGHKRLSALLLGSGTERL